MATTIPSSDPNAAVKLGGNQDELWKILPRSATPLERDLLRITSTDDMRGLFQLIPTVKRQMEPTHWLPLLLTEYGFSEIAKLFAQWRPLLAVAKDLRGKWGTPYAVEEMCKLLRYNDALIWEHTAPTVHFPEFQVNLGEYEPDLNRIGRLRKLVNIVKPARGRFRRVFHGWDDRQAVWDDSSWDGGQMWDKESGVNILPLGYCGPYRDDDMFLVSFGLLFIELDTYPEPELLADSNPATNAPMPLIERTFGAIFSESTAPAMDYGFWDGFPNVLTDFPRIINYMLDDDGNKMLDEQGNYVILD